MKKRIVIASFLAVSLLANAQQKSQSELIDSLNERVEVLESTTKSLSKLKVSGYFQAQFQHGDKDASLRVGNKNEAKEDSFNRLGIRRGRVKFTYSEKHLQGVFQLDITEKGVGVKDAYLKLKTGKNIEASLQAGVFDRPFGYEISYSSSRRESPERSMIFPVLFPNERDLGVMIALDIKKVLPVDLLQFKAGLFAGNGIKQETDNAKDLITQISAIKTFGSWAEVGLGVSYYHGKVYQGTENVFTISNGEYMLSYSEKNKGEYAKRQYFGVDARTSVFTPIGVTKLTVEYLWGKQPAGAKDSKSPNSSSLPSHDVFLRDFNGGYAMLVQDLGNTPLKAVAKYDWYDANTKLKADDIGLKKGSSATDLSYSTLGVGLLWEVSKNVRATAYYDIVMNEKSMNLKGYEADRKDNVFTLRLQYKF